MNISAGLGVAVREFPLTTGDADYMLYADGKAIGVVEAKPEGHTLTGVETQSGKYLDGLPPGLPALPPAAPLRLRIHRRRHAVHERPGAGRPQPRGLHLPPARRTDPPRQARRAGAGAAAARCRR